MKAEAVALQDWHVVYVAENLREQDFMEVSAVTRRPILTAVEQSVSRSDYIRTVVCDEEPVALFGAGRYALTDLEGFVWMLSTPGLLKIRRRFVRHTKKFVQEMFEQTRFMKLSNYVSVDNTVSIQWLRWTGFEFGDPEPYGLEKQMFYPFWMEKGANHVS